LGFHPPLAGKFERAVVAASANDALCYLWLLAPVFSMALLACSTLGGIHDHRPVGTKETPNLSFRRVNKRYDDFSTVILFEATCIFRANPTSSIHSLQ